MAEALPRSSLDVRARVSSSNWQSIGLQIRGLQVRILPDPLKTKPLYEWKKWYLVMSLAMKEWVVTLRSFLQEAWAEFQRVQWPSRKEVRAATIVVISLVTIIALYLFLVDWVLSWLLQAILRS